MVAIRSDSNTGYEKVIEDNILSVLGQLSYFQKHNDYYGCHELENDTLGRSVVWGLVKGNSDDTIILINHHDAVDIKDYGALTDLAFRPEELKLALIDKTDDLKLKSELESGKWIVGRGTADMKGGLAIQLGVVEYYSKLENFEGNILFISVPDEETLSNGMLSAVYLINEIKERYSLDYKIAINSEPYFNNVKNKAILHQGSVGKIMPVIYVKGVKCHISDPYSGINPSLILSEIQKRTELNPSLCDVQGFDASPPPIWINLKDRKKSYDASTPEAAVGYFNWLTFSRSPKDVIRNLKMISEHSLMDVIIKHQQSYDAFCMMNHEEFQNLGYKGRVMVFGELYLMAEQKGGDDFLDKYSEIIDEYKDRFDKGQINLPDFSVIIIEFLIEYLDIEGPAIVIGLSGPYYPHITNELIKNGNKYNLEERINRISTELYGIEYESRNYFMGMCDLSYIGFVGEYTDISVIKNNSPGWDYIYKIPFEEMKKVSIPVLNLGPWGKDLHKKTERVHSDDVFERIPQIMRGLINEILDCE